MKRRSKKAGIDTAIEFFARARSAIDAGLFSGSAATLALM
jgi:hypothetical protein